MTSTRAIRRLIGSAAVATAGVGISIAASGLMTASAAPSAYQLCEQVILSGDFNHTFGTCVNSPIETGCLTVPVDAGPQTVTLNACVVD